MEIKMRFNALAAGVFGVILGAGACGAAWYGSVLAQRADITRAMLMQAKCDPAGFVSIIFADASQYTCAPIQILPPTSRVEARARRHGG